MATIAEWRKVVAAWARPGLRAGLLMGLCGGVSAAAQYTAPPPPLTQAPCVPTRKTRCAPDAGDVAPTVPGTRPTDRIPFPGETLAAPAAAQPAAQDKNPFPGSSELPGTGSGPAPESPKPGSAAAANPFPGEAAPAAIPGSGSSSSSSSSSVPDAEPDPSSGTPTDAASAKTPASPRAARRLLPKSPKSMADREAEDLDVSKFYLQTGNLLGAYLRAQDAVKSVPDDSEAHFALGLAAQKMQKKDEAVKEYKAYLDLEPDGDHVKEARLALVELAHQGGPR